MGAHTHALHQLPVRGTRTQHHPSRGWQRPLWPLPAKPHPHLLPSFLVHMNPGWLTLRILGNYLWLPISGPSSPAHLPPRHIPARWPEKRLPRLPLCCPWRCCSSGPSQNRTPPSPGSKQPGGSLSFATFPGDLAKSWFLLCPPSEAGGQLVCREGKPRSSPLPTSSLGRTSACLGPGTLALPLRAWHRWEAAAERCFWGLRCLLQGRRGRWRAARGSGLCRSHLDAHPGLARALVLNPGLALPLAGRVARGSHLPSLGPSPALGGSLAWLGSVRCEVAALCQ